MAMVVVQGTGIAGGTGSAGGGAIGGGAIMVHRAVAIVEGARHSAAWARRLCRVLGRLGPGAREIVVRWFVRVENLTYRARPVSVQLEVLRKRNPVLATDGTAAKVIVESPYACGVWPSPREE